jgi:hypothetical protein
MGSALVVVLNPFFQDAVGMLAAQGDDEVQTLAS